MCNQFLHEHWHVDISYLNIKGTFYYLCSVPDSCSRYIVHHEIRESMKESDVEMVLQRAKKKYPAARPRIISDNGPQFIAKDFKEFNGKLERWHKTLKGECVRPGSPLSLQEARELLKSTFSITTKNAYTVPLDMLHRWINSKEEKIRSLSKGTKSLKRPELQYHPYSLCARSVAPA